MNKKLILSSLLCSVAAFSGIVVSTLAWFMAKRSADDSLNNMNIVNPGFGDATLIVHPVKSIEDLIYEFDLTEAEELPTYDQSGIIYNKYEKALVFELDFRPNYACTYNIAFKSINAAFSTDEENYLSNCIDIYNATFMDNNLELLKVQKITPRHTFVSYTGSSDTVVVNSKTQLIDFGNFTVTESDIGETFVHYFIVEYNMDLLEYISNSIDAASNEVREQTFYYSDIYFEIGEASSNA